MVELLDLIECPVGASILNGTKKGQGIRISLRGKEGETESYSLYAVGIWDLGMKENTEISLSRGRQVLLRDVSRRCNPFLFWNLSSVFCKSPPRH